MTISNNGRINSQKVNQAQSKRVETSGTDQSIFKGLEAASPEESQKMAALLKGDPEKSIEDNLKGDLIRYVVQSSGKHHKDQSKLSDDKTQKSINKAKDDLIKTLKKLDKTTDVLLSLIKSPSINDSESIAIRILATEPELSASIDKSALNQLEKPQLTQFVSQNSDLLKFLVNEGFDVPEAM